MATIEIDVPRQGVIQQDIALTGTAELSGRVLGVKPAEQALVYVLDGAPDLEHFEQESLITLQPNVRAMTYAERDGTYLLDHLAEGTYNVLVIVNTRTFHGGFRAMRHAYTTIQIRNGAAQSLDFDME